MQAVLVGCGAMSKAWLYWAQTDWPDMMQFQRCHQGG